METLLSDPDSIKVFAWALKVKALSIDRLSDAVLQQAFMDLCKLYRPVEMPASYMGFGTQAQKSARRGIPIIDLGNLMVAFSNEYFGRKIRKSPEYVNNSRGGYVYL